MLAVTNNCSDVKLSFTEKDTSPYLVIDTTLFILDINKTIAEDIVSKFKTGTEFPAIDHITIQQYNLYRDKAEYKDGLSTLFDYLIFYNQAFVNNGINIVAPDNDFLSATSEQILASQKTITSTQTKFPGTDKMYVDINPYKEEINGGISLTNTPPLESITMNVKFSKSYEEIQDIPDATKDKADSKYYLRKHIQHDIVVWNMGRTLSKFFGALISSKESSTGTVTVDIWNIVKEEEVYVATPTE